MQELNNYQLSLVARSFVEQQLQLVYHPQDWWEKKAYIDPQIYPKIDGVEIELNKESARTFINVNKRKEGGGGVWAPIYKYLHSLSYLFITFCSLSSQVSFKQDSTLAKVTQ